MRCVCEDQTQENGAKINRGPHGRGGEEDAICRWWLGRAMAYGDATMDAGDSDDAAIDNHQPNRHAHDVLVHNIYMTVCI